MGAAMFEPLLEADPSFGPAWRLFLAEWGGERDLPQYLALSELARHIIALVAAQDTDRLESIFDVVERWHLEGEPYVREAATIGLLETLQNTAFHETTSPEQIVPWLRPTSLRFWNELNLFWSEGRPISND